MFDIMLIIMQLWFTIKIGVYVLHLIIIYL